MGDDKSPFSMGNPFRSAFHASLLLLGAAIALNLAIAFLRPLLPWILGGIALITVVWVTIAVVRWRRSKW